MREEAVAARLGQHALARIDQDHRKIGGRRAGHHVARVLFVPRRVGDDELALLGREEAIGDVDRDPLLALGGKAVDEQRKVDLLPLRPDAPAVESEEHTSELQSLMRISYAVFCLTKKKKHNKQNN